MAKFKVLNKKGKSDKPVEKDEKGKVIIDAPIKTDPQFMFRGKPVYAGDVVEIDTTKDAGMSEAKELVYRELAEPEDPEAKKIFKKFLKDKE